MRITVDRFIIIPIASIHNDTGQVTNEQQLPAMVHFSVRSLDLPTLASNLEKKTNEKIIETQTANSPRRSKNR